MIRSQVRADFFWLLEVGYEPVGSEKMGISRPPQYQAFIPPFTTKTQFSSRYHISPVQGHLKGRLKNGGLLKKWSTCDLEGHELLNLVDVPNKRGRLYRRHEAWQNVIAWFLRRSGIGIMGSAYGTPPTCKGIFSMAAAQATGWHAMGESAADDFRKENYLIADIIVYLDNLIFRNFQDEDLPPAVLRAIGKRQMLDAKTIQGQGRYFDNKSSQPAAVADKR